MHAVFRKSSWNVHQAVFRVSTAAGRMKRPSTASWPDCLVSSGASNNERLYCATLKLVMIFSQQCRKELRSREIRAANDEELCHQCRYFLIFLLLRRHPQTSAGVVKSSHQSSYLGNMCKAASLFAAVGILECQMYRCKNASRNVQRSRVH